MIHMLYKLTDTHLSSVTQCAMKVSLATQFMSHTVATEIYVQVDLFQITNLKCTIPLFYNNIYVTL